MRRFLYGSLIVATLSGTGLFDVFGLETEACEEEASDSSSGECSDCAEGCALCVCCPRVVTLSTQELPELAVRAPEPIVRQTHAPADSGFRGDIFQPPRA